MPALLVGGTGTATSANAAATAVGSICYRDLPSRMVSLVLRVAPGPQTWARRLSAPDRPRKSA